MTMPKRTPQDWEPLDHELHAAGVSAEEIQAGTRRLLAENRGHQLAETRKFELRATFLARPAAVVTGRAGVVS